MKDKKRRLSQQDLKQLGARPGLQVVPYDAAGETAAVLQLAPESFERRRDFARRLTDDNAASEGG